MFDSFQVKPSHPTRGPRCFGFSYSWLLGAAGPGYAAHVSPSVCVIQGVHLQG